MLASRLSVLTTRGLLYRPIPIAPLSSVAAAAAAPSTTSAAPAIETTIKYKFHDKEHNLPADFEKVTVNGKYRLPRLSARQKADVRKRMLVAKALDPQAPSWNPAWDTPNKSVVPRPPKGHRDEHKFKERYVQPRFTCPLSAFSNVC